MKRIVTYLITGVIVSSALAGCGGGGGGNSLKATGTYAEPAYAESSYASDDMYMSEDYAMEEAAEYEESASGSNGVEKVDDETVKNNNRKIIKTVNISAETEEFDSFVANVNAKVIALGGYMENTDISGRSINSSMSSMRRASMTARIPAQNLDSFVDHVSTNSNILNKSESASDVTLNYADTAAHIKSLRTEQDRLNELLMQAEDIETILAIETRITDVRYELESYESRLRTMDNQVDYSTVYINVNEVERYTPVEVPEQTVGERIIIGFTENLISAKEFLVDFFVEAIVAIPIIAVLLLFLIVPVVIVILIVLFVIGRVKGPQYRAEQKAKRAERKAAKRKGKKQGVKHDVKQTPKASNVTTDAIASEADNNDKHE